MAARRFLSQVPRREQPCASDNVMAESVAQQIHSGQGVETMALACATLSYVSILNSNDNDRSCWQD